MNVITVPKRVTGVEVDDVDGSFTSLDVSWDKPGDGGATIDEYTRSDILMKVRQY